LVRISRIRVRVRVRVRVRLGIRAGARIRLGLGLGLVRIIRVGFELWLVLDILHDDSHGTHKRNSTTFDKPTYLYRALSNRQYD
jgi:hypothetical protein